MLWKLIIMTAACMAVCCLAQKKDACNDIPVGLRCDDPELMKLCDSAEMCMAYNSSVYNQKVKLTVLYETLCPDSQNFIINVLEPKIHKALEDIVSIELVPYGNAKEVQDENGTWWYECEHGPKECLLNRVQACAIQALPSNGSIALVVCMETALAKNVAPLDTIPMCFDKTQISKVDQNKIKSCYDDDSTDQTLTHKLAQRTHNTWPAQQTFVPWVIINDVSTSQLQGLQSSLDQFICSIYRGGSSPTVCDEPPF